MIIVSVGAGLGNQMFEYAFFYSLGKLFPFQEIKIDDKYAFPNAHNGIELFDIFSLKAKKASLEEIKRCASIYMLCGDGLRKNTIIEKIVRKLKLYPSTMIIQDDYTEYEEKFFEVDSNKSYYFYGPFANYSYFKLYEKEIKGLFVFPPIIDTNNQKYLDMIKMHNSVSIHIRRGDYVSLGIPLLPLDFYTNAIVEMEKINGECNYYVFSDDPDLAKTFLPDNRPFTYINCNIGKDSFRDMQLMSMCRHNIIANSTFSFWAAFLNENVNKTVIAPKTPFPGCKYPFACDDWILL